MLRHADDLLGLIRTIHAGALSDEAWIAGLDQLSDAMGGVAVVSGAAEPGLQQFRLHAHRVAPESAEMIKGSLVTPAANPLARLLPFAPVGVPIPTNQVCTEQEFLGSPVYQLALRPFKVRHVTAAVLDRTAEGARMLALGRFEGSADFDADDFALLALLIPHLATAAKTRDQLASLRLEAASAQAALGATAASVLVVDRAARVLMATPTAEAVLAAGDGLMADATGLYAATRDDTARLHALVAESADTTDSGGACPGGSLAVARPSGKLPYAVHVAPLSDAGRLGLAGDPRGAVVVTIRNPETRWSPSIRTLRAIYNLSPAEAALTAELCSGCSLSEAAKSLNVSQNTAKTQLKAVFEKVGVSRQAALVRRVLLDCGGPPGSGT